MSEITRLSVTELSELLQSKTLSAKEAAQAYLSRMDKAEPQVGAYLTVTGEEALKAAENIDSRRMNGESLPPLAGVPMGIKDNICTKGIKTTCASRILSNFEPAYDATAYRKMKDAGCVLLGKMNMDEFAMGSSTENSSVKVTRNPRDLSRVPGGSSGGPAAAVAAGEAAFALGSDTGGSIRQPASFCGVVGMKPTYGSVSRFGLIAFASSLDQIGPLTRNVADSALVLNALCGHDSRDSTSVDRDYPDYMAQMHKGVKGLRIAVPKEFFGEGIQAPVKMAVEKAAAWYESQGAEIIDVSLPTLKYALPAYYVISSAEASSNLARFDGVRYGFRAEEYEDLNDLYIKTRSMGFGPEVKRRIMLGTFALSAGYFDAYYKKALQVRTKIMEEFSNIFASCQAVLSPVAPTTAYKIGEKTQNPLEMYLGDIYTVPVSIAGLPALSVPCGADGEGLPIGMQLTGRPFSEPTLYRIAHAYEQENKPVFGEVAL
jgi:aspartyl-tRNA(Asn)/glutamyl-tRNA(Gln) amidotransferase subunit A